jgi:hypothetical protein
LMVGLSCFFMGVVRFDTEAVPRCARAALRRDRFVICSRGSVSETFLVEARF